MLRFTALATMATLCVGVPLAAPNIVELAGSVPDLSTLVTAVKVADLVETLSGRGPFTVFAPTNEAFEALPRGLLEDLLKPENKALLQKVLTYHVVAANVQAREVRDNEVIRTVEGENITAHVRERGVFDRRISLQDTEKNSVFANVIAADREASNGVVHIIDRVLIPTLTPPSPPVPPAGDKTIVELAASVPDLSTLVTAVKTAGLVETLSGRGPFTVFAPTNEAFAALPKGLLEDLLKPENKEKLTKVLLFHVVSANVQSRDVQNGEVITTVEGEKLLARITSHLNVRHIYLQETFYQRDLAEVVEADVEASNGVVHVIDKVLIPPRL